MKLYSTNSPDHMVSLKEAVLHALPGDRGLYMPLEVNRVPPSFLAKIAALSFKEIAYEVAHTLIGTALPEEDLGEIIERSMTFPAPVQKLQEQIHVLELFHGPSLAFKDFGARFMAQLMSYLNRDSSQKLTILVATSGDTGGAVAAGFLGAPGIEVIILYPSGRVTPLQEKQLTTLGQNIYACEVSGSFDDCQHLVKTAFLDSDLKDRYQLSSANSINIARLIPQSFYYFEAYRQLHTRSQVVFSVPSGNFGNLTAGLLAARMGLPVRHFLAATNINRVVPDYLATGEFHPQASLSTLSNAMDVGNPSNFARMLDLFGSTWNVMKQQILGFSYSDEQTRQAMLEVYQDTGYVCDPHGAIGWMAARDYLKSHQHIETVFLETAHPAKFLETVEETLHLNLDVPERLAVLADRIKVATPLPSDYAAFKDFLISRT